MLWFLLSLLCALFEAAKDIAAKLAGRRSDALTLSLACIAVPLPFYIVAAASQPVPPIGDEFVTALVLHSTMFSLSIYLYTEALRSSELSLTVPLICLTPAFFLVTSPLIAHESFSPSGIFGIALIAAGAFSLYFTPSEAGVLETIRRMLRERGARLMLFTAFLWSITGIFDRKGILASSVPFWGAVDLTVIVVLLALARWLVKERSPVFTKAHLIAGALNTGSIAFYYWAASLQKVAYVVTVKRFSVLLGVVFGALIFGEQDTRKRLAGAALMVVGVAAIAAAR